MNICRRSQREQKYKHIQVAECVGKDNHMWPFDKPGPGPHASDLHWFPRSAYMTLESCDPVEHEQSGLKPVHYPSEIVSHMFCILIWGQYKQKGRQFSGPVFRFLFFVVFFLFLSEFLSPICLSEHLCLYRRPESFFKRDSEDTFPPHICQPLRRNII